VTPIFWSSLSGVTISYLMVTPSLSLSSLVILLSGAGACWAVVIQTESVVGLLGLSVSELFLSALLSGEQAGRAISAMAVAATVSRRPVPRRTPSLRSRFMYLLTENYPEVSPWTLEKTVRAMLTGSCALRTGSRASRPHPVAILAIK